MPEEQLPAQSPTVQPTKTVPPKTQLSLAPGQMMFARFDAAQTTLDNKNHWGLADGFSADAAYNPGVRRIIRQRARHELENNPLLKGMISTYVNDILGDKGPRLQFMGLSATRRNKLDRVITKWAKHVRLLRILRTALSSRITDGEVIIVFAQDPTIPGPIKLRPQLMECDRLQLPYAGVNLGEAIQRTDGIELDTYGNPMAYHILKDHPGDAYGRPMESRRILAPYVYHMFKLRRPEQHRGVSEIAASLGRFADLRRYTAAVIAAAETAADFSAVIHTDQIFDEEDANLEAMDKIPIDKRSAVTLPNGWTITQLKAEQPTTGFAAFRHEIIADVAREFNMPYLIAAGDSSGHNFASAKLDTRQYIRQCKTEQEEIEDPLDSMIRWALMDLSRTEGWGWASVDSLEWEWLWQRPEEVDPREASATATKLQTLQTTLADVYADRGLDWRQRLALFREILDEAETMGIPLDLLGIKAPEQDLPDEPSEDEDE